MGESEPRSFDNSGRIWPARVVVCWLDLLHLLCGEIVRVSCPGCLLVSGRMTDLLVNAASNVN